MPKRKNKEDMIGLESYNNKGSLMKIIDYKNNKKVTIYFPKYNYTCIGTLIHFYNGDIKCPYDKTLCDIGYLGEGPYKVWDSEKKKVTPQYKKWSSMINRCYSEKTLKKASYYRDCYVCEEWLNFQNFAQWYDNNYYEIPNETMHLDKDILIKGNLEYSPNTCCFIPSRINCFIVDEYIQDGLPPGVQMRKEYKKKPKYTSRIGVTKNNKSKRIHFPTVDTPEEAFLNYKEAKEAYIKEVADEYIEYLPPHVYEAMYNWTIDIDD